MSGRKKIILIAVSALAVLALLAATVLPILIRNKAVEILREATGRNVRIEKVSLNPLTLTAAERIFEKNDDVFKPPAKNETPKSRVELGTLAE
jgi:hypothetical protein